MTLRQAGFIPKGESGKRYVLAIPGVYRFYPVLDNLPAQKMKS
jgi:hypothetical protein